MRVISGEIRGKRLKSPKGKKIRPTSNKVKEAIFNILGQKIVDCIFLDLFAGTGNIGIEALSRGAQKAVFVDNNFRSVKLIKYNLVMTGFADRSMVIQKNSFKVIEVLGKKHEKFDIIFMDPPYDMEGISGLLEEIYEKRILKDSGIILIEHRNNKKLPEQVKGFIKIREKLYGDTCISFFMYDREEHND
ncbi:Ribosomal RNA small subunit methyltransferase D [Koleobacter methoxysyntrophicus]|uniref:Ribosomal RNA small subunit methyltransferase D n=1 Tax=Koleobacter methoxysyntrophicus TaxID=2751313 RepID=A0A8A0RPJ5_9FIRM|nr:16S rRNA (guanine(966)-N(2))-methyltransferase RsmD [Koleobacter methoxysyntrophicus]QSQ09832.1 Ribosomal RNA small subunit methyltransferase D [Koleobacter methoxysyntrophicus]